MLYRQRFKRLTQAARERPTDRFHALRCEQHSLTCGARGVQRHLEQIVAQNQMIYCDWPWDLIEVHPVHFCVQLTVET
jgi:hypothetical protein